MKRSRNYRQIIEKLSKCSDKECEKELRYTLETMEHICKKKDERLEKILKLSDKQQMAILKLNEELDAYKNHLEQKVEDEIQKRKAQEVLLIEQSRLAAIAEMMDAVAHQWTQPLNLLSVYTYKLMIEAEKNGNISIDSVTHFKENVSKQIEHMTETLNHFREFFRPIETKRIFSVSSSVESVLELLKDDLVKHNIQVDTKIEKDFEVSGNPNEFKHILLNLISNTKYAFNQSGTKNRKIIITITGTKKTLTVADNAGGIPEVLLDKIFDMHVTTKQNEGTGIGLYISQQIAQKHQGILSAENTEEGAKFTFTLTKDPL